MTQDELVSDLMTQRFVLIEALFEIATESHDADAVRRAIAGLQATAGGMSYLAEHTLAV
jgi:hypothetical protein